MLRLKKKRGKKRKSGIRFVKGDITEIIYGTVLIFITAIVILIMYKVMIAWNDNVQDNDLLGVRGSGYLQTHTDSYPATFDAIFTFLLVGVGLILLVSSFMVKSHPIFFVVTFLIFLMFIVMWSVMANTYDDFANASELQELREEFVMMEYLMRNFPFIMLVLSSLVAVIQFAKDYGGGGLG